MPDNERVLRAILQMGLDQQMQQQTLAGIGNLETGLGRAGVAAGRLRREFYQLSQSFEDFKGKGLGLGNLLNPIEQGTRLALQINDLMAQAGVGGAVSTGKWASVAAYGAGRLLGGEDAGLSFAAAMSDFTGETQGATIALQNLRLAAERQSQYSSGTLSPDNYGIGDDAVEAWIKYQEAGQDLETKYQEQRNAIYAAAGERTIALEQGVADRRTAIVAAYERQAGEAAADFSFQRLRELRDFLRSEQEAEADYYDQRTALAASYGVQVARMEQDHQRAMLRMREDFDAQADDLAASRDAYGLMKAQREYERNRRRAEEDYQVGAGRRSEDYARQLAEMETQFAAQREQRQADFELQQRDAAEDFARSQARAAAARDAQLEALDAQYAAELARLAESALEKATQLDTEYDAEKEKRRTAFVDQLRDLGVFLGTETETRLQFYERMRRDLERFLVPINTPPGYPPMIPGVPVIPGLPDLGGSGVPDWLGPEAQRYQQYQQSTAGQLPQGYLPNAGMGYPYNVYMGDQAAAGMAAGQGGGAAPVIITVQQPNWTFGSELSDKEVEQYRRIADEAARSVLGSVVEVIRSGPPVGRR